MPEIGESTIRVLKSGYNRTFRWTVCPTCGEGRWLGYYSKFNENYLRICRKCECKTKNPKGALSSMWKGGRRKLLGYIDVKIYQDSPFFKMANKAGYVREHRLVMAQYLGRCLEKWEVVHHRNGIKDDNRLENLELLPNLTHHASDAVLKSRVKVLERVVNRLENELLRIKGECDAQRWGTYEG